MILRFSSGSVTPASASRNRFWASTTCRSTPVAATKSRSTCSASPLRSRPWSTKTQVSRSPIARCTRAAATAESTPPERPQIARPWSPICSRIALDLLLDDVDHRPGRPAAGDVVQEVLEHLLAVLGVHHLGVPLHAGEPPVEVLEGGDRGDGGGGEYVEAGRRRGDRVAVATSRRVCSAGRSASSVPGVGDRDRGAAVLAGAGVRHLAAEAAGHQLEAVAHAEDRDPGRRTASVEMPGAPSA